MRERAQALNGQFRISESAMGGFKVSVQISINLLG